MHDILITRSPKLDRTSIISYAEELGLDMKKFIQALDSKEIDNEINLDIELAQSMDLYNTPTFYINGTQVVGERPFEFFKKLIDGKLQEAKE